MVELAVEIYLSIMAASVPIAVVFELGNLIVGIFLRAAFGGKLWIGK